MRPGHRLVLAPIAVLAIAFVSAQLAGCAALPAGPGLTLTLASPDMSTDPNAPLVKHFSDEVARLSQGTIQIEPEWDVTPPGTHPWDQVNARLVADGTYDLGLVPSGAFDQL